MEYRHVDGPVYCRYALTPPVINSALAEKYGIEAPSAVAMDEGKNVKLRMVVENGTVRMTCHARVDWVKEDESTGEYRVGLSRLSLADPEFRILARNFVARSARPIVLGKTVRDKAAESAPVTVGDSKEEITRVKGVTLPVSLIEAVDAIRGELGFSRFVVKVLREHCKESNR
jgi:hypothetical protein